MSTTKVKWGKRHNVQAYLMKSKAVSDTTYTQNASNIEITLTIIPDLYLMEQGPMPLRSQLVWWMPYENTDLCGGEKGLHMCKWIPLVM
jgi:hypothetical protein